MKKIFFLLLLSQIVFAAPFFEISTVQQPAAIQPGSYFSIQIQIRNTGDSNAEIVKIAPEIKDPFGLKTGSNSEEILQELRVGQVGTITFHLKALPNTQTGIYDLKIIASTTYDGKVIRFEKKIPINIEANPDLEVVSVEAPENVYPGDKITIWINIQNVGLGNAKEIRLVYPNISHISPSGAGVAYHPEIKPGETSKTPMELLIGGGAEAIVYTLPISIQYKDEDGNPYSLSRNIGLKVESDINLDAFVESAEPISPGKKSKVVVSIANTGANTAQYLRVYPIGEHFSVGPASIYIGNLESDDFDTITLDIETDEEPGKYPLGIKLVYKDQYNNEKEENEEVLLTVISPREAAKHEKKGYAWYIAFLLIIGALIFYWKKTKK